MQCKWFRRVGFEAISQTWSCWNARKIQSICDPQLCSAFISEINSRGHVTKVDRDCGYQFWIASKKIQRRLHREVSAPSHTTSPILKAIYASTKTIQTDQSIMSSRQTRRATSAWDSYQNGSWKMSVLSPFDIWTILPSFQSSVRWKPVSLAASW